MEKTAQSRALLKELSKLPELGKYVLEEKLGEGTFGMVVKAKHSVTNKTVALKFVELRTQRIETFLKRETKTMSLLDHPNIVKFFEEIPIPEKKATCLVLEYIDGGELFDFIVARGKITEDQAIKFFRQMISAIEYCHYHSVVHRDLKPENVLLDSNGNVKITDFGLANIMTGELMHTVCGSPMYTAPEIIKAEDYVGPEVDIWSLGVILYVMVTGYIIQKKEVTKRLNPWLGENVNQQLEYAVRGFFVPPQGVSEDCTNLIRRILNPDPKKRATIEEIRNHPWVNKGYTAKPISVVPSYAKHEATEDTDDSIIQQIEHLGFSRESILKDIGESNTKSQAYVLYQLMYFQKKEKEEKDKKEREKKAKTVSNSGLTQSSSAITPSSGNTHSSTTTTTSTTTTPKTSNLNQNRERSNSNPMAKSAPPNPHTREHPLGMKSQSKTNVTSNSPNTPHADKKNLDEEKPLLAADLSGGFMNMFKAMGIRIPQKMDSNPQLKLSQDFTPEDLEKLNKKEKYKIKVVKKNFTGKVTDRTLEECMNQIERALNSIQWSGSYKLEGFRFCGKEDRFGDRLKFEVEVCEVHEDEKTKYGISFRRTAGSVFHYKEVIAKLALAIQL